MATNFLKVTDSGESTLYADVNNSQTEITIHPSGTSLFPSSGNFKADLYNSDSADNANHVERVLVTGVVGNVWTVTRAQDGTTAGTYSTGNIVRLNVYAQNITDLNTAVNTVEGKLTGIDTGTKLNTSADANFTYYGMARQAIINGNFDVWQRGTTTTNPANGAYIADRWRIPYAITGTAPTSIIHSRQTLTPGELANSYYFYRVNPNGAGSGYGLNDGYVVAQTIEGGTKLLCGSGKTVTLSFYARSSISGKKLGVYGYQYYGSGGTPSTGENLTGATWTLSSTWTKYTCTLSANTLTGKTFGTNNDDFLQIAFVYAWGTGAYATAINSAGVGETFRGSGNIDITQIQLCAGDIALPFQPKSYDEEYRACLRYFEKIGGGTDDQFGAGHFQNTTTFYSVINMNPKRTTPRNGLLFCW
jgi:hypothetical protein